MKIKIKHRWSEAILFAVEANNWRLAVEDGVKSGADLRGADLRGADLRDANLRGADLRVADLQGADLRGANLRDANLWGADLEGANLRGTNLRGANLRDADLRGADLEGADLEGADLEGAMLGEAKLQYADLLSIKHNFWAILLQAIPEVPTLRQALLDGKIDGSVYQGECSCLCGTIAKQRGLQSGRELAFADPNSQIELFVKSLRPGDTPNNNSIAHTVMAWIDEFQSLLSKGQSTVSSKMTL